MYISIDSLVAIILMTIALTWFLVACGYTWRDVEARLLIDRLDDENYELKQELSLHQQEQLQWWQYQPSQPVSEAIDATDMASYQMLCGPVVTLINNRLAYVKEDMAYPFIDVGVKQFNADCEDPLSCQAHARAHLEWLAIDKAIS